MTYPFPASVLHPGLRISTTRFKTVHPCAGDAVGFHHPVILTLVFSALGRPPWIFHNADADAVCIVPIVHCHLLTGEGACIDVKESLWLRWWAGRWLGTLRLGTLQLRVAGLQVAGLLVAGLCFTTFQPWI